MIRFPCKCGFEFNVADDRAGELTQCPRCGLLADIPRADEATWLAPDGTYAIDESTGRPALAPGESLADLYRAYSRKRTDEDGVPLDLRPDEDDLRLVGEEPPAGFHKPQRIVPRYDPETGERILPLGLKDEVPRAVVPLEPDAGAGDDDADELQFKPVAVRPEYRSAAVRPGAAARAAAPPRRAVPASPLAVSPLPVSPLPASPLPVEPAPVMAVPVMPVLPVPPAGTARSLTYATAGTAGPVTLSSLALDLIVRPPNLTVLFFVWWFYAAGTGVKLALNLFAGVVNASPTAIALLNVPFWILLAHYGCVVEDVGTDAIDELPRPLRNLSIGDDVLFPAIRVAAAAAICFGPALAVAEVGHLSRGPVAAVVLLLTAAGTFLFPAVVLTLLTGATVLNLTPVRVLGVAATCGGQYAVSALACGATMAITVGLVLGPAVFPQLARFPVLVKADNLIVLVPGLAVAAYVTHLFAWHLALMYRMHHDAFPWVAQRHVPRPRPPRRVATPR